MRIIISGPPGAGKSFLAQDLAKRFGLTVVHASHILKELSKEKGVKNVDSGKTKSSEGFWDSDEASDFLQKRLKDAKYDIALDKKLLEILKTKENVIFDSRTLPWLSKPLKEKGIQIFCIWLDASETVRAQRITSRDKKTKIKNLQTNDVEETRGNMQHRYEIDGKVYQNLYGIEYGEDFTVFDLILDTDDLPKKDVAELVAKKIKKYYEKSKKKIKKEQKKA